MLYSGEKVQDTAHALGVHRTTIWRWECTRDFRREWKRLERNQRRRCERRAEKLGAEESAYWERRLVECDKRVRAEAGNITDRPSPAFYKAWNEYETALFGGLSMDQVFSLLTGGNIKRRKRWRR